MTKVTKKDASLGSTIKRLVVAEQEKKFSEFDQRLTELEEGIKHVLNYMKDNERSLQEIESRLTSGLTKSPDMKRMKDELKSELSDISSSPGNSKYTEIKKILEKNNQIIEKSTEEIYSLKQRIDSFKDLEDILKGTDIKTLGRNLEILRTRSQWLEDRLEKFNVQPILEKIEEIEVAIKSLQASSPLIME